MLISVLFPFGVPFRCNSLFILLGFPYLECYSTSVVSARCLWFRVYFSRPVFFDYLDLLSRCGVNLSVDSMLLHTLRQTFHF
jgi:hypothetical protein